MKVFAILVMILVTSQTAHADLSGTYKGSGAFADFQSGLAEHCPVEVRIRQTAVDLSYDTSVACQGWDAPKTFTEDCHLGADRLEHPDECKGIVEDDEIRFITVEGGMLRVK